MISVDALNRFPRNGNGVLGKGVGGLPAIDHNPGSGLGIGLPKGLYAPAVVLRKR